MTQNHKGEQVAGALLGRPVGVQTARAFLIGGATPRHTQEDAFKRTGRQWQEHESAARMAMKVAQKKIPANSPLNLRATCEAALKFGRDCATLGGAAREAEVLLEAKKITKVSLEYGRVQKDAMHVEETVIPGVQPSVQLTPEEQAEKLDVHTASGNTKRSIIQLPRPHITHQISPTATFEQKLDSTAHSGGADTELGALQAGRA